MSTAARASSAEISTRSSSYAPDRKRAEGRAVNRSPCIRTSAVLGIGRLMIRIPGCPPGTSTGASPSKSALLCWPRKSMEVT
jgi:hypothetical protein